MTAGFGGLVGLVAQAVGRPAEIPAGSDGDVILGDASAANQTSTTCAVPVAWLLVG